MVNPFAQSEAYFQKMGRRNIEQTKTMVVLRSVYPVRLGHTEVGLSPWGSAQSGKQNSREVVQ